MFAVRIEHRFIDGVEARICPKCKQWLALELFSKNRYHWDGLQRWCRWCTREHHMANQKIIAKKREWQSANPEKIKEYRQRAKEKNPEAYRQSCTENNRKRRATLKGKLCGNISSSLYHSLKRRKNGQRTFDILGYTYKQLKRHLTKTMPVGYSWDDYMAGQLHMDHKTPISVFHFDKISDDDFQRCWALKNLQLLPAGDNLKKSNKLTKHFQPSLIFG